MRYKHHDTPCIGVCSTIYGDNVCRGCKRFSDEVITWNTLSLAEKDAILSRLDDFTHEETNAKLVVVNPMLLEEKVKGLALRYRPEFSPYSWAYALLRVGAERIQNVSLYGIEIKAEFKHLSLRQLIILIDEAMYKKSENHFTNVGIR